MRRSVNKNIAKPIQEVLTRQNLWQVSQFSTFLNNESNIQSLQVPDSTDETQKTEKCLSFESNACRYSPGNSEVIHSSGLQLNEKKHPPNNEDRVATTTFYYEPSFFDREEIEQPYSGSSNVYSVVSYHTSSCNSREFELPEKNSSYKEHIENREECIELDNIKEREFGNEHSICSKKISNTEHNEKLKQFKEGVMKKIKQGCYTRTLAFNNNQLEFCETYDPNTVKSIDPFSDNGETENEYVRSILNGIPSQNNSHCRTHNSKMASSVNANCSDKNRNDYFNTTCQSKNSVADRKHDEYDFSCRRLNNSWTPSVQFGIAIKDSKKYSQEYRRNKKSEDISETSNYYKVNDDNQFRFDKVPVKLNLKNIGVNKDRLQQDPSTCMIGKDSTLIGTDNQMTIGDNEEFRSRNYSLRNGYDQSDILQQELTTLDVSDRSFHSSSKSSNISSNPTNNQPESYRLRNGFIHSKLQEYCTNDIPVKPEYPVYKKGSFGSNFKKYTITESVHRPQNSSKREPSNSSNDTDIIKPSQINYQEEITTKINNKNSDEPKTECHTSSGRIDEDKPLSQKYIKSDTTDSDHHNDASKDTSDNKFNSETFNEKEKEFKIQNNKQLKLSLTDKYLESNQIGSYYQSDRQNKVISEATQFECKPVTESQDSGVQNKVTTDVKPNIIRQMKSGESEPLTNIAIPTKESIISKTSNLKSTSFQSGCKKDAKDIKIESVQFTLVRSKPPEQCPLSNKAKINTFESAYHNSSKLGNSNVDSTIEGKLVVDSYKQKSNKNLLKESEDSKSISQADILRNDSQKLTLNTNILKDKTKTNSLTNISNLSSKEETQKVESIKVTTNENQSYKANVKVHGSSIMVDDKEKGAEIIFPGITPPTFCVPVSYENVNKLDQKPKGKADIAEKITPAKKDSTNKDILTFSMAGTRDSFKLGKYESIQPKLSTENANKNKTHINVTQNNTKQGTELQANNVSLNSNKTNAKSTGHSSTKKETNDLEVRKARVNSVKPELKKLTNIKLLKEKTLLANSRDSYPNQFNADKLATLLKEHRVLLELLLEKLNGRTPPSQSENSSGIKKNVQPSEELNDSDKSANTPGGVSRTEQFKKMLAHCINSQEKVKRLHPRHTELSRIKSNLKDDVSKEEDIRTDIAGPILPSPINNYKWRDTVPPQEGRKKSKTYIDKPLKRFHVVTMMTSPSGRHLPKKSESLLDGTKLAKYNYSPLRQILCQYRVDWSTKPRRLMTVNKTALLSSSENKKITKGVNYKTNWRNVCFTSYLNTSEKKEKTGQSKEDLSQIKKVTMVNKKKNYNTRDNIKKRHLHSKNKIKISIISNLAKMTKKQSALVKEEDIKADKGKKYVKTGEAENTKVKSTEENNVKLSKGTIFDSTKKEFHKPGNKNYSSKCTLLNNEINSKSVKIKNRSLKDVERMFKFVIRPSVNPKPSSSGFESKSDIFNFEYSNNIIKGAMWVATPEYNHNKVQWNLPTRINSSKTDTINNKLKINQMNKSNTGKTLDLINSLSKKVPLSKVLSLSTKSNLSRPSSVPVLKSAVLPLPLNFFNHKSIHKSKTDFSRTVGIKKISTCNINKEYEKGENFKLLQDFSDSTILPLSSITSNKNKTCAKQKDYKELDTASSASDKPTNNLLGSCKEKSSKYSTARNNLLFGRIRRPDILNIIKPSFFSFRSMSHKDSSTRKDEDSSTQTEEKLKILPNKKILTNKLYIKSITSLPRINSLKISWTRISNKVKHIVKAKCGIDNSCCCTPNFDEMMTSISKDVETNCWEKVSSPQKNSYTNKFSKHIRSKELAIIIENGKSLSRNNYSNSEPKVLIIPQFLVEKVKNF